MQNTNKNIAEKGIALVKISLCGQWQEKKLTTGNKFVIFTCSVADLKRKFHCKYFNWNCNTTNYYVNVDRP